MCRKLLFLSSLVLVLALAGHIRAADDPIAHYQFEGVNDFNNTGTNSAAITGEPQGDAQIVWDDDRGSYVISLDGKGDYVYFGASWQGIVTTKITVAAWIKTSSLSSSASVVSLGYAWRIRNGSDGSIAFQVMNTNPVSAAFGTIPVDDGTWHHVAGSYDGTEYKLYIDGRTNVSVASAGVLQSTITNYYGTIGAHYKKSDGAPKNFFEGLVDDVRIYDRILSEEEILEITGFAGVKAAVPGPADGRQLDVVEGVVLNWKPGVEADEHDVYFGESLDDVTAADTITDPCSVYKGRQDPNQYAVGETLGLGKTYYWRIDEVGADGTTIHEGDVWQFTAEPIGYQIPGSVITATASSSLLDSMGPQKTIDGSGLDGDLHSTFMEDMWLSDSEPQPTWIEFQFDKAYKLHEMWVWNQNQVNESVVGYGIQDVSIEYSVDGIGYTTLGTTHEFNQPPSPEEPNYAHNTTVDLSSVSAKYIKLTAISNWGGWFEQYGLSEVRFFYVPVRAREPDPADGATGVDPDMVLGWRAGREAATHDVHIGNDQEAVLDGTAYVDSVAEPTYDAGALDLSQTYFWRVDEVDEAQNPALEGELWSFTTPDYLIVDDFESYNDLSPGVPESNRIFLTWIGGDDDPANGSQVGHDNYPFAEQTIVHGGENSMPLFYNNSFKYSEAKRVLSPAQDWTKHDVKTLSLNFYGDPDNTAEEMYLKINDFRVTYDGDPAAVTQESWSRWNIDLALFDVDADLANVTTLAVGFGDEANLKAGGLGVVYFDDFRLYRWTPEPPLEIWFEAEAADSITAPMQIYDSPQASGGQYIGTPEGSGDETERPPAYGVASYNFTVPEGTYKVLLHVIVIGGADSFWVRIPGADCDPGTSTGTGWIKFNVIDKGDNWHWDEVHRNSVEDLVVKFTLTAGDHTLEIARRDDNTLLDAILITDELDLGQKSLPHVIP